VSSQLPADRELVSAARAGEAWAAGALYRRHRGMIARVASRFQQGHDCDDLVQDAFLVALRNLDQIEHPELFSNWLRAVVIRTAFARMRHQRLLRAQLGQVDDFPLEDLAWRGASPDVSVDLNRVYRMLDRLPFEARVVFILRRVDRMSIAEVAAQLGRSVATVKRRLAHVERMLDRRLADARRPRLRPAAHGTPTV
jgi:RNA polymerase sigma-70 factor (ECF subfamily)